MLLLVNAIFAQNQFYRFYTDIFYNDEIYITPEKIYSIGVDYDEYSILPRNLFTLNDNGYFYYKDDIILLDNVSDALFISEQKKEYNSLLDFYNQLKRNVEERYLHFYYSNRSLEGETRFKASSELREDTKDGTVIYEADNLGKFAFDKTEQVCDLYLNFNHKPWVEGAAGYGIGESIEISCDTKFSSIMILNGYVDFDRIDLYKKNSRVKIFKVMDLDNKKEYFVSLDDEVKFQFVYFEKPTKNVCFIIEDVYKGNKWSDTCVSGMIPSNYKVKAKHFDYLNQKQENMFDLEKDLDELLKRKKYKE